MPTEHSLPASQIGLKGMLYSFAPCIKSDVLEYLNT